MDSEDCCGISLVSFRSDDDDIKSIISGGWKLNTWTRENMFRPGAKRVSLHIGNTIICDGC